MSGGKGRARADRRGMQLRWDSRKKDLIERWRRQPRRLALPLPALQQIVMEVTSLRRGGEVFWVGRDVSSSSSSS